MLGFANPAMLSGSMPAIAVRQSLIFIINDPYYLKLMCLWLQQYKFCRRGDMCSVSLQQGLLCLRVGGQALLAAVKVQPASTAVIGTPLYVSSPIPTKRDKILGTGDLSQFHM